jgi:hypothetical protein
MRRATIALLAATALLCACGGSDGHADAAAASPSSSAASSSPSRGATATATATTPKPQMEPEQEAQFVASVTARTFTQSGDVLSAQLVKSSSLVEAQTDFRFDQASRTVIVAVTSVFKTGTPDVAYSLATNFAPLFWGSQATAAVRPESLPLLSVTVDDKSYRCDAQTMVALASRELSKDMFAQRCGGQ